MSDRLDLFNRRGCVENFRVRHLLAIIWSQVIDECELCEVVEDAAVVVGFMHGAY